MSALAPERPRLALGWWGMAMLAASESAIFAMLIGSYFYLRAKAVDWPPAGVPDPKVAVPLVLLAVLLLTSLPLQLAHRAGRAGRVGAARRLVLLALVVQAGYLAMQVQLYRDDLSHFAPQDHAYASIYYTLLGAAHAHVALGLLFDAWILARLVRGATAYRLNALQAIALYWHAVNAITVAVTLTILSPGL